MAAYYRYFIKKNVDVKNLVTVEYLDISPDFSYEEEVHPFYEFAYVDEGSILCCTGGKEEKLSRGELFCILPGTKHFYRPSEKKNAKLFIVCANCKSEILEIISGRNTLDEKEKSIAANVFSEAKKAFRFPFDKKIVPLKDAYFGAQQLTEVYIEILLTYLVRKKLLVSPEIKFVLSAEEFNDKVVGEILTALKENVYGRIDLNSLTERVHYSKTYINKIFKDNVGTSIMQYYYKLKITEARKLLSEGMSVGDVSDKLCYDNPNYFTKAFKSATGSTPSKYSKSIDK